MKSRALYNRFLSLSATALALWTFWLPAEAEARCLDVALVLAIDGSSSVDSAEYQLQKQGIAEALRDPQVIAAMRQAGDVAVSVIFWGDAGQPHQKINWFRIADSKDGDRLAQRIERMHRNVKGSTGLGTGLVAALDMIAEATLSFIGAGTPPIIPSWGNIMAEGRALWQVKPYIVFFPAVFLSITVLSVNLLGDGMRDALDPRMAKRI